MERQPVYGNLYWKTLNVWTYTANSQLKCNLTMPFDILTQTDGKSQLVVGKSDITEVGNNFEMLDL